MILNVEVTRFCPGDAGATNRKPARQLSLDGVLATSVFAALLTFPLVGLAQTAASAGAAAAPLSSSTSTVISKAPAPSGPATVSARPAWGELTPAQRQALKPLEGSWSTISEPQRRKWLEISKTYVTLAPDGQATLHSRMNEWVLLSPQQRAQARLNFATTKELSNALTPEEKKAKWQTYQALSPEEKASLAAKASPKPAGAATAVRPVAPQKLAAVAPASAASKPSSGAAPTVQPPAPAPAGTAQPAAKN